MEHAHLDIQGMSCGHCVARVNRALTTLPGVQVEKVEVGSAEVAFDPARTPLGRIIAALHEAGYPARAAGSAA